MYCPPIGLVFSSVQFDRLFSLQRKVLRGCKPAEGGGFSIHTETVLWTVLGTAGSPHNNNNNNTAFI